MKTKVDKLSAATTVFVVAVILAMTILSCKQLFADPVQYLIMANADTQELYFSHQLEDDGVFSVSYIHSVNKTNVEEYYRLENGDLYLFKTRYRSFGAGVATEVAPGQTLRYEYGYMIIENIHYQLPKLVYKVGTISDPLIHIGSQSWHMKELAPSLTSVQFTIQSKPKPIISFSN